MNRKLISAKYFAKIFFIRYQLRRKAMDLHALSRQQVADIYLSDILLNEIRKLQAELNSCLNERTPFTNNTIYSTDELSKN